MGFLEEKQKLWKEAEERAKAMHTREEEVKKAAKAFETAKEAEDVEKAAQGMKKAYADYDQEYKKPSVLSKLLKLIGF